MDEGSKSGGGLAQPRVHPPSAHYECQRWPPPHQIRKVVCFLFSPSFHPFLPTHVFFFFVLGLKGFLEEERMHIYA